MGKRSTVYNANLTTEEDLRNVLEENKKLLEDFINYCVANNKSPQTRKQYEAQLKVFFCWNLKKNDNKFFVNIKKKDFINFFGYAQTTLGWSSSRLCSLRAVLSSLSNYVERILDEEYSTFRNVIKVLEPIPKDAVREKTIINENDIQKTLDLLVGVKEYQLAAWLAISFASGMRKSEVLQMKVDFFKPENIVFNGLAYATPKIRTKGRGVQGKQVKRYIFVEYFQKYFDLWMEERKKLGIENEYLFVHKRHGEWVPAGKPCVEVWVKKIGKIMGVDLYAHSLRHAQVSYLKRKDFSSEVVQAIQSWSSIDLVSTYDDATEEDKLEDFFKSINTIL